jgi:hypothetical protein
MIIIITMFHFFFYCLCESYNILLLSLFSAHHLDKPDRASKQHHCDRKTGKDYQETPWPEAYEAVKDYHR